MLYAFCVCPSYSIVCGYELRTCVCIVLFIGFFQGEANKWFTEKAVHVPHYQIPGINEFHLVAWSALESGQRTINIFEESHN